MWAFERVSLNYHDQTMNKWNKLLTEQNSEQIWNMHNFFQDDLIMVKVAELRTEYQWRDKTC